MLVHGLQVMDAWGFKQKQVFVWVKIKKNHKQESDWNDGTSVGMGRLFRQSHEIALIGTLGSVYTHLNDRSQRSVAFDLNVAHSVKPPTLQDRLELMFPNALRLEVFARRVRPSWTCVGNAIDGKDVTIALNDLITL
jgi:N6-adenosine-specific RNA methylase IME4